METGTIILHITQRQEWLAAQAAGRYEADTLSSEGFIHCSRPDQVVAVANSAFCGRTGLVLLCIDSERVDSVIRYENLRGGEQLYPHIYGPLNVEAVVKVLRFEAGQDGRFALPVELVEGT
jgi:uncharacterized protein (DUF952 family)